MIKIVLFDADGVVINGPKFSVQLEKDYAISTAQTLSFFTGEFNDCLVGKADLKEILTSHLRQWGWKKSADDFLKYWFETEHHLDDDLLKYIQMLRQKGTRCYLATNQERHRVEYMMKEMRFEGAFDGVFASAHLGYKKPAKEFFEQVFLKFPQIKKEEILFWDDTQVNIDAAKEFGINAEFYISFNQFKEKISNYETTNT